ncbi:MAG: hypothetical protein AAFO94_22595, partial [Bacteroidota bacterium]
MQYVIKVLILLWFLGGLLSCEVPSAQKEFTGDKQFRTTDPSRLYFSNMRSGSYFNRRKPNTKVDLYTLRKFSREKERPILYPIIVNNWLQDEAYVFIERNQYDAFKDSLKIRWEADTLQ